jgi:hypothetical protein
MKQLSAAITLKSRMATFETIDVTANIAAAIARATEVQNTMQSANLQSNLRLSNLETSVHKQEQKTNELAESLKVNESNHQKKTRNGHPNITDKTWATLQRTMTTPQKC